MEFWTLLLLLLLLLLSSSLIYHFPHHSVKKWNEDSMMSAISAVRKREMGLKTAAKLHSVPRSTLQKYVNNSFLNPKEASAKLL
jgi:alpha-N-acetylglucosamine transferase